MGRPSEFSIWVAYEICERIATTPRGLDFICKSDDALPHPSTVHRWMNERPAFCESYLRARARQADLLFDECLEIADDASRDLKLIGSDDDERVVADAEVIARAKLRVDTRMRMAGKLAPKKYGERLDVKTESETHITHELVDSARLTIEERESLRALLTSALQARNQAQAFNRLENVDYEEVGRG